MGGTLAKFDQAKLQKIVSVYISEGEDAVLAQFSLTKETFNRYMREAKRRGISTSDKGKLVSQIMQNYTDKELEAIAKGGRIVPGYGKVPIISFEGQRIRVGAMTDTHIGSNKMPPDRIYQAFEEFKKEKVDFITHSGDVTEGMSNRPGHVYELSDIGYSNQKAAAVAIFSQWTETDIYAIDGNHDRWYIKSNGAKIVEDIDKEVSNFHFIGHDEGDISLKGKATLKLWHGEDGNSYALSYRLQKILESLTGGEKPNAMHCGHTHKYVEIFERHVFCTSVGCMQSQTPWMRGKRIAAHPGFAIIDYWVNDKGICKMTKTWYPFYS
jgi:predicted phosphodiesterase